MQISKIITLKLRLPNEQVLISMPMREKDETAMQRNGPNVNLNLNLTGSEEKVK